MEKWNEMASDDVKTPRKLSTRSTLILKKVNDGSLKLAEKELAALLKAQEEIEKDEEVSSRDSSEERAADSPKEKKDSSPRIAARLSTASKKSKKDESDGTTGRRKSAFSSALLDEMNKLKHLHISQGPAPIITADRIATFFDQQGVLNRDSPTHWALQVCQNQPLHQSCKLSGDRPAGLSRRQQTLNARNTLDLDQMRRDAKIKLSAEQRSEDPRIMFAYDAQQERYLRLMFEPITDFWENMPDDILDESVDKATARKMRAGSKRGKGRSPWKIVKQGQNCLRLMGKQRNSDVSFKPHQDQGSAVGSGILTNEQRTILLNIFQRYVLRVSGGANGNDLVMARSTWFRFLHHCGILGPDVLPDCQQSGRHSLFIASGAPSRRVSDQIGSSGLTTPVRLEAPRGSGASPAPVWKSEEPECDVNRQGGATFSHASAVFAMYSEANMGPPTLTFSNWVNAIQHILRGPNFYRTSKEVMLNLFGVCLKRCENVLGIQAEKKDASPSRKNMSRRSLPPKAKEAFTSVDTIDMAALVPIEEIEPGVLGWQSHLAEEQMCEPEVLLMLHEHEVPLRALFEYYATRKEREDTEQSPERKHYNRYISQMFVEEDVADSASDPEDLDADTDEARGDMGVHTPSFSALPQNSQFTQAKPETVMDPKDFRFMARELGLFPGVVQLHSVKQHLTMSLKRRHASHLTYEAFVECLLRITFVYLSIYGNNVQQASFSKAKCMWLMTLLRVRCNELQLPNGLSAARAQGHEFSCEDDQAFCGCAWVNTSNVNLDNIQLQDLVLWTAMDAEAAKIDQPKIHLPLTLTG